MKKIAIYGGSFNPPGVHHRAVAEALVPHFDQIIILPCGPRPDKPTTNDVSPWHRAALADIAFRGLPNVEVDLSDLELSSFTTNDQFQQRYGHLGEIWHVVGSDLTCGGGCQQSSIHRYWDCGAEMWNNYNFCVVEREGYEVLNHDLPLNNMVVKVVSHQSGASSDIREKIFKRQAYQTSLSDDTARYVERYGLYRGRIPSQLTNWSSEQPRLLIEYDEFNERARNLAETYRNWESAEQPEAILVIGGDGTMLRAISRHWRKRIPFLGVNQGHLGFLLNEPPCVNPDDLSQKNYVIRLMPMLYIEARTQTGETLTDLAFNDAWVERSSSQSAWLEVEVNGQIRIPRLIADGALVCTAAGSTAYARAMGVAPLLADTPAWIVAGSNVMSPPGWKSALLSPESDVTFRSLGGKKRPISAFIGGRPLGQVESFHARLSRIATVELIFSPERDMAEKVAQIQFAAAQPLF